MKRFLRWMILGAVLPLVQMAAAADAPGSGPGSLKAFFAGEGYAGAPLQRRLGNHLVVSALIDKKHVGLLIDTGSPLTLIDRNSVATLGLTAQKTKAPVGRAFGATGEHFSMSKLNTLAMGNCMFTNVPVAIADTSDMNNYSRLLHMDGLFGAYEMMKFGIVIDCARQMLYVSPRGPSSATSQKLAGFLTSRGFTRIPLHVTSDHHFDVEATLNGHPVRLVVDTGAGTTLLAKEAAIQAGVVPTPLPVRADMGDGRIHGLNGGRVRELAIGGFKVLDAEVDLGHLSDRFGAGLLGEEHLTFNFAVIDTVGLSLYLRHPDA
jgi:predicted aspartyl protease